jgi:DNA-binding transcriptional regulator YiaG
MPQGGAQVVTTDAERPRLRELRIELGWMQQELADRLGHLAWMERREHVGVNADMVAKWERGVKGISPQLLGIGSNSCRWLSTVRTCLYEQPAAR